MSAPARAADDYGDSPMRKLVLPLAALLALLPSLVAAQAMPVIDLSAGMYRIEAEVAATYEQRMVGLMNRQYMAVNKGMLFVFDTQTRHCMWMRNTLIPLSVAFLDEQGRIINVEEMQPQTENNHCAAQPAKFALEMNAKWFRSRGLGAGTPIVGIGKAPPAH